MSAPHPTTRSGHPLDNPARASLAGPHAHFAERRGRVLRYPTDVAPWLALPDIPDADDWADAAALAGPGASLTLTALREPPPGDWEITFHAEGVQLVDAGLAAAPDPEAVRLGPADVPEMLALVERTRPGPFLPRTVELGTYLGIRREGALVAMAGERLHPTGYSEISGVCTDESVRGQGFGHCGSCSPSRTRSGSAATSRSCMPPRPTRTRSGSTSPWASGSAAGRRSSLPSYRAGCWSPGAPVVRVARRWQPCTDV